MNASPDPQLPPGWDFGPAAWPARSVLQGYAPAGLGTPMVVSLAGHVVDLAWAHGIPPVELLRWVADAGSLPGVPGRSRADFAAMATEMLRKPRASLLGSTRTSAVMVDALERLTLRTDVGATTVDGWGPVLPRRNAFRPQRAYCPACYHEWSRPVGADGGDARSGRIYEPLLWQFQALEVCVRHKVRLRSACINPACGSKRGALAAWARPGMCGACEAWLGARQEDLFAIEGELDPETLDWQRFVTSALSDLIMSTPAPGEVISPSATPTAVEIAVRRSFHGRYARFAEAIRMSLGTVSLWKDGRRRPSLEGALRICAVAGFRLPDFLAGRIGALSVNPTPATRPYIPPARETHQVHDRAAVRERIAVAVAAEPPPSLAEVNRGLHIDRRQLGRLYPAECRLIRARHLEWVEERAIGAHRERQEVVLAAMATLHRQGRYPSRHQVQRLLPSNISLKNPLLNRLWKDELVRLGYPRPDRPTAARLRR